VKNKYTEKTRKNIQKRYMSGETVAEISKSTGIPRSTMYSWIAECRKERSNPKLDSPAMQIYQLKRRIEKLERIVEVLKTVDCTANSPLKVKLDEMESLKDKYSVHTLCDALDVSRGTFYNHILRNKREEAWFYKHRDEMREQVCRVYDETGQIFGAEKIASVLETEGYPVSTKLVRKLMNEMHLHSIRIDAMELYKKENKALKNHLHQQFNPEHPDEVWVSDVTYFKCNDEVYYICVIIDLYARMVVGYRISKSNSTQLATRSFKAAYAYRQPENGLIFHTDRGSNFRSNSFRKLLSAHGVVQSFSRAHIPYDNSVVESFFASLKKEELYRRKYTTEKQFKKAVEDYIVFYNTKRPHASNRYKTPQSREQEYYDKHS